MSDTLKVVALVVVGVALVVGLAVGGTYSLTEVRMAQRIDVPTESLAVPSDITSIQRGQHLASAIATCTTCHGSNLAGRVILDDPALGRFVAPNLTRGRGGIGVTFGTADLVRAIRHGVDPTGRALLIMPSDAYNTFSDVDLGAIIAYVRSLPAIDTALPSSEVRTLGRALFTLGQLPLQPATSIDHFAPRAPAPAPGVTTEYGQYLTNAGACASCHGAGLSGGKMPLAPQGTLPAANLTPAALGTWSDNDFLRVMRTGIRPDGRRLDASMPWPYFAQMSDDELRAIWRFLQAIPARATGTH